MTASSQPEDRTRLRKLSAVLRDAADELAALSHLPQAAAAPQIDGDALRTFARVLYAQRRARAQFFDAGLFAEPAWDMLLDLFVATADRRRLTTTALCAGCGVPMTTGLRWLGVLEERRLVQRAQDSHDRRCQHVLLSSEGAAAMERYLSNMIQKGRCEDRAKAA